MNNYEMILEALQYQVDCGELTLEEAEAVNDLAYDRYVCEKGLTQDQKDLLAIGGLSAAIGGSVVVLSLLAAKPTKDLKKAIKIYEENNSSLKRFKDFEKGTVSFSDRNAGVSVSDTYAYGATKAYKHVYYYNGDPMITVDMGGGASLSRSYASSNARSRKINIEIDPSLNKHRGYYEANLALAYNLQSTLGANEWAKKVLGKDN